MKTTDEGILLNRISYSESSIIATFLTEKNGIQKFIFKGGKKKSPQLFPLSISELTYYGRGDSDLFSLTSLDPSIVQSFQFSPVRSSVAFFLAELLYKCVKNEEKDPALYNYVRSTIEDLNNRPDIAHIPVNLLLDMLKYLGIQPLVHDNKEDVFDLASGTIGSSGIRKNLVLEGQCVKHIRDKFESPSTYLEVDSNTRVDIIEAIIDYLKIHIPGFTGLDTYEIAKEVIRG